MQITKSNDTTFVNNLAFPLAIEAHARMDETMAVTMAVSEVFARSLCRKQTVHNSNTGSFGFIQFMQNTKQIVLFQHHNCVCKIWRVHWQ